MSDQVIKRGIFLDPENDTNINYDYLSKNVDFAILKAGSSKSAVMTRFAGAYKACIDNNIKVGIYSELILTSAQVSDKNKYEPEIRSSVEFLYKNYLSGRKFAYPIYIGLESSYLYQTNLSNIADYLNTQLVEKYKFWMGFCVNAAHLDYIKKYAGQIKQKYCMWVTDRGISKTQNNYYMDDSVGMWEYTTTDRVIGTYKDCSMSYCFQDYPGMIKNNRKNGF